MKIGILGGGQLGRMLIQQALKYDDTWEVLDPSANAPCANIARHTLGSFADYNAVLEFGRKVDVLSIEIEHVNAQALAELEKEGIKVIPNAKAISMIQSKIRQKAFYVQHGIPTASYQAIQTVSQINFPTPFVQKTSTGGYDGKGVQIIRSKEEMHKLWDVPSVIESLIDIEKELSVIVARNEKGETAVFPITEMVADPELNLLDFNVCPAEISKDVHSQIQTISDAFLSAVDSPGLFAIELLLDKQGKVWVNEVAPRLHNSGHQTQEGNANSQFEQMYRILKGFPLADTNSIGYSGMLNLVGAAGYSGRVQYEGLDKVLTLSRTYVHLYGKEQTQPGRKMGHINVVRDSREELLDMLLKIKKMVRVIS